MQVILLVILFVHACMRACASLLSAGGVTVTERSGLELTGSTLEACAELWLTDFGLAVPLASVALAFLAGNQAGTHVFHGQHVS